MPVTVPEEILFPFGTNEPSKIRVSPLVRLMVRAVVVAVVDAVPPLKIERSLKSTPFGPARKIDIRSLYRLLIFLSEFVIQPEDDRITTMDEKSISVSGRPWQAETQGFPVFPVAIPLPRCFVPGPCQFG